MVSDLVVSYRVNRLTLTWYWIYRSAHRRRQHCCPGKSCLRLALSIGQNVSDTVINWSSWKVLYLYFIGV